MGVDAEVDGAVASLAHLVVHAPTLDVAGERPVLEAEDALAVARLLPHARHAHARVDAEHPVEPQLQQHVAAEQRRVVVPRRSHERGIGHAVGLRPAVAPPPRSRAAAAG